MPQQQMRLHIIRIIVVNIICGNKACFCVKFKLSKNTISVLSLVYVCVCVCTATTVEALHGAQQKQLLSLSVLDSRVEDGLRPPKDRQ